MKRAAQASAHGGHSSRVAASALQSWRVRVFAPAVLRTPAFVTSTRLSKSDADWRASLSREAYYVCRLKGTEAPWSGELNYSKDEGIYKCACCGAPLFSSDKKFDSGSGWPSFYDKAGEIDYHQDSSHGMRRVEVTCSNCDAHLGHVFDDGPKPTGLRYCINSVALRFEKGNKTEANRETDNPQ